MIINYRSVTKDRQTNRKSSYEISPSEYLRSEFEDLGRLPPTGSEFKDLGRRD